MYLRDSRLRGVQLLAAIVSAAFVLAACGGGSANSGATAKTFKIGVLYPTLNNPFFVAQQQGVHAAAQEFGATVVDLSANNDASAQTTQVENLIAQHVDAILLQPVDVKGILGAVAKANAAHIPVVQVGEAPAGGQVATAAYFDEVQDGALAGQFLAKNVSGSAKVAELLGLQGTSTAAQRQQGFETALQSGCAGCSIVGKQPANFDRAMGLTVFQAMLRAHPEITGLYAANDEMALGAAKAISEAGKQGKVVVVGTDGEGDALDAIAAGTMSATTALSAYQQGFMGIEAAVKNLKGAKVCSVITEKGLFVTKDNFAQAKDLLNSAAPAQRYWESCFA
jgi:ribose transport system substrate-binding protein